MSKRAVCGFVVAVALTLVGFVTAPSTAGAEPRPAGHNAPAEHTAAAGPTVAAGCPRGHACILNASGQVIYSSAGNVSGISIGGFSVWNNGYRYPGADHIQLFTRRLGIAWTICLHYGPQTWAQPEPTLASLYSDEVVTSWYWRGECVGDEDYWKRL